MIRNNPYRPGFFVAYLHSVNAGRCDILYYFFLTLTFTVALLLLYFAVTVAVPAFFAVALPDFLLMERTDGLEELHVMEDVLMP